MWQIPESAANIRVMGSPDCHRTVPADPIKNTVLYSFGEL